MSYSDEMRYKAISMLDAGVDASAVAEELNIGKSTVIRWKKEYEAAKLEGTLHKLLDIDVLMMAKAELIKDTPEGMLPVIEAKTAEMAKGLTGLAKLDEELQGTALHINQQLKSFLMSAERVDDVVAITECLCALRRSFFDKGTQVNVQNNYNEGGTKYGEFLGDKPAELPSHY